MNRPTLSELKDVTSFLNVLYVEDEAMLRDGLHGSLKQLFRKVAVAEDGAIGLELYKNSHFDLVITDISMPNMNGIAMITHIKAINPCAHIIVTSAQNDNEKLLTLINLGIDRFLVKPIDKAHLIDALYSVCSGITNTLQAEQYRQELERKVRLLNTQMKKEYVRTAQAVKNHPSADKQIQNFYEDYFHHLLQDERDELRELNEELDSDIIMAFQNDRIDPAYVIRLSHRYSRYGTILTRHTPFAKIGILLQMMSHDFEAHKETFIEKISSIRELLESFNFTLITFRQQTWEKESPNPTFYNPSLISDIEMIQNFLTQTEIIGDIEFF